MRRLVNRVTVVMLLSLTALWADGQTATPPSAGDGSEANPYQIATLENLYWLSQTDAEWNKHYIQTADIDASATAGWDVGDHDNDAATPDEAMGFSPIGYYYKPDNNTVISVDFTGTYDGLNHVIDGLYMNRPTQSHCACFGVLQSARISNLGITNADVTGGTITGILAGETANTTVEKCYSTGSVTGGSAKGGIVGGLVAYLWYNSFIHQSYSSSEVYSDYNSVGGLVGILGGTEISESFSTGTVQGNYRVGGLVGDCTGTIVNSYSHSDVTSVSGGAIGGFIGSATDATIRKSYSAGSVTYSGSYSSYDGFIGYRLETTIEECLYDSLNADVHNEVGGFAKSTEELCNLCNYNAYLWDFLGETTNGSDDYWGLNAQKNGGYPFLAWQDIEHTATCYSMSSPSVMTAEEFAAYPNPTHGPLTIRTATLMNVELINSNGQVCKQFVVEEGTTSIDLSSYPKGLYIIRGRSAGETALSKIILR